MKFIAVIYVPGKTPVRSSPLNTVAICAVFIVEHGLTKDSAWVISKEDGRVVVAGSSTIQLEF